MDQPLKRPVAPPDDAVAPGMRQPVRAARADVELDDRQGATCP
jgi:hypothetical protein